MSQRTAFALHELGDAGAIKGYGNATHRYIVFQITHRAWEYVDASSAGFDSEQDMVVVMSAESQHDQIDRDVLLAAMGLSAQRLDSAALLLHEHDYLVLVRPGGRGLMFSTALATHKSRQFARKHTENPLGFSPCGVSGVYWQVFRRPALAADRGRARPAGL
jgi:hypothetical protein